MDGGIDRRRLPGGILSVIPLGALAGHQLAELLPHSHEVGAAHGHGHLVPLAALALPLAVLGAARLVAGGRRRALELAPLLALGQLGAFLLMEAAAQVAGGGPLDGLAASPLFWAGVAAQVVVATLLLTGVRAAGAVRSLVRGSRRLRLGRAPCLTLHHRARGVACRPAAGGWPLRRGPPLPPL